MGALKIASKSYNDYKPEIRYKIYMEYGYTGDVKATVYEKNLDGLYPAYSKSGKLVDIIDFLIDKGVDPHELLLAAEDLKTGKHNTAFFSKEGVYISSCNIYEN